MALGTSYFYGTGVPQDYVRAHMWLNIAAAEGQALEERLVAEGNSQFTARSLRDTVAEKMTSAQLAEAQKLAREWWERPRFDPNKPFTVVEPTP